MPRYICKIDKEDEPLYFEWSTIVDAPITQGMSLEEFKEYYILKYGSASMLDFNERMKRVDKKGTSALHYESVDELLKYNRAGDNEEELTKEEIIEHYVLRTKD